VDFNGAFADVYIVFAKVDGEKFTGFIVERNDPGVTPAPKAQTGTARLLDDAIGCCRIAKIPKTALWAREARAHLNRVNISTSAASNSGACVGGCKTRWLWPDFFAAARFDSPRRGLKRPKLRC